MKWQDDLDQTFRVYHLARWVWKVRDEKSPKGVFWVDWFEKNVGMSLYEFMDWSIENDLKSKVAQDIKDQGYRKRKGLR